MDQMNYQHGDIYERWSRMTFSEQMLNIGSEVSRALKWKDKKEKRSELAFYRALELFHFTVRSLYSTGYGHRIKELGRAKEVLYDYLYGDNVYKSTEKSLLKYYNDFIGTYKQEDNH
jgi:hypothetical protein